MAVIRGLVLLFLIFSGEKAAADRCSFGWTPFGVECFKFFSQAVDWVRAEKNCQSLDANLASVRSKAQNEFLLSLVPGNTRVWIGGHDGEMEKQWLWIDGSPFDYTNWCKTEPNNEEGIEDCLEISYTGSKSSLWYLESIRSHSDQPEKKDFRMTEMNISFSFWAVCIKTFGVIFYFH